MKKLILIFFTILFFSCKKDRQEKTHGDIQIVNNEEVNQTEKEDPLNLYNSQNRNLLDLLEALDFLGVQVHKFYLGDFDKEKKLVFLLEEYKNGNLIKTDTICKIDNKYIESFNEDNTPDFGFIDQVKMLTKTENNQSEFILKTYKGQMARKKIKLEKIDNKQFFQWREYLNSNWISNKKVPLLIFASSWYDDKIDNHRFCGIAKLTKDEESTNDLLNNSPHYMLISYKTID